MENLVIKIDGKEHQVQVEETDEGKLRVYLEKEGFEVETKQDIEDELADIENEKSSNSAINEDKILLAPNSFRSI